MARRRTPPSAFRYFNSSPEVIRLAVMMSVLFKSLLIEGAFFATLHFNVQVLKNALY